MDLETAANLLLRGDNQNYFKNIYKHYGKSNESPLKDYLEFIKSGMYNWFMLLPNYIVAKTTFSKPKTAIISVLKNVNVVKYLGKEYCEDFIKSISNFYKTKGDEILNLRKIRLQNDGTKEAKETPVPVPEPVPVPVQVPEQEPEPEPTAESEEVFTVTKAEYELLQKKYEKLKKAFESVVNLYVTEGKS